MSSSRWRGSGRTCGRDIERSQESNLETPCRPYQFVRRLSPQPILACLALQAS